VYGNFSVIQFLFRQSFQLFYFDNILFFNVIFLLSQKKNVIYFITYLFFSQVLFTYKNLKISLKYIHWCYIGKYILSKMTLNGITLIQHYNDVN